MRVSRPARGIVVHVNCLLYPTNPASCGGAPLNILKSYIEQLTFSGALYPRAEVRGFAAPDEDKPGGGQLASKRDATLSGFRVSYLCVPRPPATSCLPGLKLGALPCVRASIVHSATL